MNAVKVDPAGRIHLDVLKPGDMYEPEIHGPNEITLRRIPPPPPGRTKQEVLRVIEQSPLRFAVPWEQLREETRG